MNRKRRQGPIAMTFAHGWRRASDPGAKDREELAARRRRRAPAGTSLLLMLIVVVLAAIGIVRVHASTRVLQLGAEITDLTAEQTRLADERRRLAAERAYLRHPDQIGEAARDRLGMVPIAPDMVQTIRLQEPVQ